MFVHFVLFYLIEKTFIELYFADGSVLFWGTVTDRTGALKMPKGFRGG